MSVEGKEIICFQLLYQLINGNIKISEVSKISCYLHMLN